MIKVSKLNIIKNIDERSLPYWEERGYKAKAIKKPVGRPPAKKADKGEKEEPKE